MEPTSMNQRIQELIDQATDDILGVKVLDKHMFAELIVRECALVAFKKAGPKTALDVLEHFGVEE